MLKKLFVAASLLVVSLSSQAGIVEFNGHSRDTSGSCDVSTGLDCQYNIVTGAGLEWLKWDVTKGMSIVSALDVYAQKGWALATSNQMAGLFNTFMFGKSDWSGSSTTVQQQWLPWNQTEDSVHNIFFALFGITDNSPSIVCTAAPSVCSDWNTTYDPKHLARAYYGPHSPASGLYSLATISDDVTIKDPNSTLSSQWDHVAELYNDILSNSSSNPYYGVALVRSVPSQSVSLSGTFGLFALGLTALALRRRK